MRFSRLLTHWLMVTVVLLSLVLGSASFAAAQCAVRTDWPVYVVQRGDTLARIALRYGTPLTTLTISNCLTNPNLIFAGQQLRVPPSPGTVITPPPVIYPSQLAATYQPFERGFMTWKAGTGEIAVYYAPSGVIANGGSVRVFSSQTYAYLLDNVAITIPQPAGTFRPVFGFGKVWSNYPDVQQALGWATAPETGYLMQVYPPGATTYQFIIPDGRTVYVSNNALWSFTSSIPTIIPPNPTLPPNPSTTTTTVSYQPYQGGFMIWEAHTGNVVAFYNNSTYQVYTAGTYASLRDNPVTDPTPAGLVRPAFGLGKVWGNYSAVRQTLGWATQGETTYPLVTFQSSSPNGYPQTCFQLPGGQAVIYALVNGLRTWSYASVCS